VRAETIRIERGVFVLRLDISEHDLDRGELVPADAAAKDLVEPGTRIEMPPVMLAHHGNREGPVVVADDEGCLVETVPGDRMLRPVRGDEFFAGGAISDRIAGADDLLSLRSEHLQQRFLVFCLSGVDQRRHRIFGAVEALLR
jgi:hypothetical protein